jgi:hypothetical protein
MVRQYGALALFPETGLDERRTLLDTAIGVEFAWVGCETFVKRALSQATLQLPWPAPGARPYRDRDNCRFDTAIDFLKVFSAICRPRTYVRRKAASARDSTRSEMSRIRLQGWDEFESEPVMIQSEQDVL